MNSLSSDDGSNSTESDVDELQDTTEEDTQWRDVNEEREELAFVSLFGNEVFEDLDGVLQQYRDKHGVDLKEVTRQLGLDFYGCIRLVNYVRSEAKKGNPKPDLGSATSFQDEKYLQPVLADDAVLFSLDDLLEVPHERSDDLPRPSAFDANANKPTGSDAAASKVAELEEQIARLQRQFADYRAAVEQTLELRWTEGVVSDDANLDGPSSLSESDRRPRSSFLHDDLNVKVKLGRDDDKSYFESYAYNDIHETMLRDDIRTDSYRDFIYENKSLFASKSVLDVGCGTGILSMFAAKAGAKHVYAVDNSNIITKAKQIVANNGLSEVVTCIRGKIEEITIPSSASSDAHNDRSQSEEPTARKIDILVSEWMGYGLLFESMLDSVLHARDRFLKADTGLMVPSHCSLRIAPIADCEFISESLGFWDDVYGFDYKTMSEGMCEDVLVRRVEPEQLAARAKTFRWLDLYKVKKSDLQFKDVEFEVVLERDLPEGLQAWCIWFDTFFVADRESSLEENAVAESWPGKGREDKGLAFTTGPGGKETHWKTTMCVIDHAVKGTTSNTQERPADGLQNKQQAVEPRHIQCTPLKQGQKIKGSVGYKKSKSSTRDVDIEIAWDAEGTEETGKQVWLLR